ncbi:carboxylesterase family protein [Paenibacillus rhizoplanae]
MKAICSSARGQKADSFEQSLKALEQLMGVDDLSELTSDYSHTWEGQAEVLTDLFFWASSISFAEKQQAHGPVWMYRFDWTVSGHPLLEKAIHGAEILYVFNNLPLLKQYGLSVTPEMEAVAEAMQTAWTAFAHGGDPAAPGLDWPQYTPETRATMIFDQSSRVVNDPDGEKRRRIFLSIIQDKFTNAALAGGRPPGGLLLVCGPDVIEIPGAAIREGPIARQPVTLIGESCTNYSNTAQ